MSLVPLLYFSRGQLESADWPDAAEYGRAYFKR